MPVEYPLNVDVHCTDGRCGRSTHIILNPATKQVTHLVVREKRPSSIERLVPASLVAHTAAEVILLSCSLLEFSVLEAFNQTDFVYRDVPHHAMDPTLTLFWPYSVPAKRVVDDRIRPIPPGELAVRRGAQVRATDGRIGRVDQFLVQPDSGNITHLCLREGSLREGKQVCIPVSDIDRIQETLVHLKIDKEAVAALPPIATQPWD
jgi:sporulation protein YlmC with PRC-barrel domain